MIYLQDADVTIHQGDVLDELRKLPDESVHMCCTSPPFYGLRDYGTGTWEGGDEGCDHKPNEAWASDPGDLGERDSVLEANAVKALRRRGGVCHCGARRVDQQIGLEATPDLWVARLVDVFREVRRVLRSDGTLWVEIGDSYNSHPSGDRPEASLNHGLPQPTYKAGMGQGPVKSCKPKDLIGAPWLLAFALRADGWWLRSEIIWAKPNPMPESVTDRPTTSHSRVFLLAKSPRYFYDAEAIREANSSPDQLAHNQRYAKPYATYDEKAPLRVTHGHDARGNGGVHSRGIEAGRNRRSVWTIATQPRPEAHFATWPEALCRDMILAGTSERGVCPECGAPWERVVAASVENRVSGGRGLNSDRADGGKACNADRSYITTGWQPTCTCRGDEYGVCHAVPATILDPFGGSGTTAHVARKHGRRAILIELSPDYCALAARRLQQQSLFA